MCRAESLDALVVSGDLVNRADPTEYDAARQFLERLIAGFGLSASFVVPKGWSYELWQVGRIHGPLGTN